MPPRGRKRQRVESEPEPEPRQSSTSPDRSSPEGLQQEESPPPFYNTTFSTHRVSPLYIGKQSLSREQLQTLSQRLREILVGDVVRGVEVGLGRADGEDGGAMGRAGALEFVDIRWVSVGTVMDITGSEQNDDEDADEDEDTTQRPDLDWSELVERVRDKKALHILLRYEMAECTALLLPSSTSSSSSNDDEQQPRTSPFTISGSQPTEPPNPSHFLHLRLLLLRMPAPLKTVITDFLSTTFDCRVSNLRLGTRSLVQSWESWIRTAGVPASGPLAKDVVLNLGFYIPPPSPLEEKENNGNATGGTGATGQDKEGLAQEALGIKGIDVIIPAAEVRGFVEAGKKLVAGGERQKDNGKGTTTTTTKEKPTWETDPQKRRKLAGRLGEEGWEWRTRTSGDDHHGNDNDNDNDDNDTTGGQLQSPSPFTEALARYVDKHLGLNLFHPGVRVTKIACGGFVMSEGRLKVFAPRDGAAQRQRAAVWGLVEGLGRKAQGGKGLA